jgi:HK97 gp10 family phage protein
MGRVVMNMKAAMAPLAEAEKRLVAIGLQAERDIKESISGPGPAPAGSPPGVDTGRLRASISTNWTDSSMERGIVDGAADASDGIGKPDREGGQFRVVVGTNVSYAPWLEWGTRKMGARPFMRPCFDRIRARVASMMAKGTVR